MAAPQGVVNQQESADEPERHSPERLSSTMKKTLTDVLIVDDDDDFRRLLLQRLTRGGFAAEAVASGLEALDTIQRRQFDVVVSDVLMPEMSGIELLKRLKASFAETEVILLTGQGTIESAVQAIQLGAFNYLQKPFGKDEMKNRLPPNEQQ